MAAPDEGHIQAARCRGFLFPCLVSAAHASLLYRKLNGCSVIVFSVLHLDAWIHYTKGPPSPFLIVPSLIWQQTLLAWSVISATIPNLKAFLQSLSANWGGVDWGYTTKAYGNGTFELKNMNSGRHGKSATESNGPFPGATGSKEHHNGGKTRGESASLGSGGSQDLIIRKETAWTVERS